jgi:ubiquinone biosynthesis protein
MKNLPSRSGSATLALLRAGEILFLVVLHGTGFAGRAAVLSARRRFRRGLREELLELLGASLVGLLQSLGPTFVKAGQILSSRPDLFPPELVRPLSRLQDSLPPIPAHQVPALVQAGLSRKLEDVFSAFDSHPIACGSIAQVHRARLLDDTEVAVKVRRPGVEHQIERDLRLLRGLGAAANALPGLRAMPVAELVEEIGGPILQQANFRREARSNQRFQASFSDVEHVWFPAVIESLCSDSVLTMEFAAQARKVTSAGLSDAERETAALAGLRALYRMIFVDGFIHADLHPGNVFVRRWGEVVIVDSGLTAELSALDQRDYVDFFFGLVNNRGDECARIIWDTAAYRPPHCDRKGFDAAVAGLIGEHSALRSQEFEITRFVYQLMEIQRRFRIRGSTRFIMTILAMVVYDGICKQLFPKCDFQREARGFLLTARYRFAALAR